MTYWKLPVKELDKIKSHVHFIFQTIPVLEAAKASKKKKRKIWTSLENGKIVTQSKIREIRSVKNLKTL